MGDSSTTVQENKPFEPAIPGITAGLKRANRMFKNGGFQVDPFQGRLVAGFDPLRRASIQQAPGVTNQALGSAGNAFGALNRQLDPSQALSGIQGVQQNVIESLLPAINSSFAGSGQTGSSLHAQNLAKGLASGLAAPTFDAFNQAQNRSLQAAGLLPTVGAGAFDALRSQSQLGAGRQGQRQDIINANVARNQQRQQAPIDAIQNFLALTTGAGGVGGTQSADTTQHPGLLSLLGGIGQTIPFL